MERNYVAALYLWPHEEGDEPIGTVDDPRICDRLFQVIVTQNALIAVEATLEAAGEPVRMTLARAEDAAVAAEIE